MTEKKTRSREGWTRVRFGDVVRLATERCADPLAAGIERYVGLEHLEPGDLRIRTWGNVADGVTFTNRFRPGQVLFGKRRAYQRKVAVPDFAGVCSGDIYVFEPADDQLLPDLLPFVCQSEGFFEHALKTSAGSLSPRTNWKSLQAYEFDLPPVEEQRRIGRVLDAARDLRETSAKAISAIRLSRSAIAKAAGKGGIADCQALRIDALVHRMQYGVSVRPEPAGGIPLLRMGNLVDGMLDVSDMRFVTSSDVNAERDLLSPGDVLFNRTNSIDLVGKAAIFSLPGDWAFASYLVRLIPRKDLILPEFLVTLINCQPIRSRILSTATKGVSQANINTKNLGAVVVPVPPIAIQQRLVNLIAECREVELRLAKRLACIPAAVEL
jgi:type I restriction enzyme, S subunit